MVNPVFVPGEKIIEAQLELDDEGRWPCTRRYLQPVRSLLMTLGNSGFSTGLRKAVLK